MTDTVRTGPKLWVALLVAGALALALTLFLTARQIAAGNAHACALPTGAPKPGAVLVVAESDFRLGQGLCIGVNTPVYLGSATKVPSAAGAAHRIRELQLYFNGKPMPATLALDIDAPRRTVGAWAGWQWVHVELRPAAIADTPAAKPWREFVAASGPGWRRDILVGVAAKPAAGAPPALRPDVQAAEAASLEVVNPSLTLLGAAGLLLIAASIVTGCWNTGLLRDRVPLAGGKDMPPFSLGRTQLAFWLLLSVAGFLAIWLTTGARSDVMTDGMLTLLGIAAGSGLAARLIDSGTPAPTDAQSAGFLLDVISEGYGTNRTVAVHRIQMVAWTLILGVIFVWTVFTSFTFPDFDTNLLLLMGISSGTYLGFKFPEKGAA
ncbi:MAG TPA: hypothetical protein PK808_03180 [Polymorphobacter sp.]|nr:hypothetical protein [Polymorphobacter sp.]